MRKRRSSAGPLVALVLAVLVIAGGAAWFFRSRPLEFTLSFRNSKGLAPGQAVTYRGEKIGEVRNIRLEKDRVLVGVEIAAEHEDKVFRESGYEIRKPGGMLDLSGEKQVAVSAPSGTGTPVRRAEVIEGSEGLLDEVLANGKEIGVRAVEVSRQALDGATMLKGVLQKRFADFQGSPEGQEFTATLEEMVGLMKEKGATRAEEFRRDDLPRLTEKAIRLRDRMKALGKTREAQEFWQEFVIWKGAVGGG